MDDPVSRPVTPISDDVQATPARKAVILAPAIARLAYDSLVSLEYTTTLVAILGFSALAYETIESDKMSPATSQALRLIPPARRHDMPSVRRSIRGACLPAHVDSRVGPCVS